MAQSSNSRWHSSLPVLSRAFTATAIAERERQTLGIMQWQVLSRTSF